MAAIRIVSLYLLFNFAFFYISVIQLLLNELFATLLCTFEGVEFITDEFSFELSKQKNGKKNCIIGRNLNENGNIVLLIFHFIQLSKRNKVQLNYDIISK